MMHLRSFRLVRHVSWSCRDVSWDVLIGVRAYIYVKKVWVTLPETMTLLGTVASRVSPVRPEGLVPRCPTFWAAPPELAAHSRSADMVISRLMMMVVGMARADRERGAGGLMHSRMRVVATLGHTHSTGSHSLGGRACGADRG